MNTNKVSACSRKVLLSFEMLLGQFKVCLMSEKTVKKRKIHYVIELFPHFPLDISGRYENDEFQICLGAQNLNEEQKKIILKTKNFPQTTSNPLLRRVFTKCSIEKDGDYFTQNEESRIQNVL